MFQFKSVSQYLENPIRFMHIDGCCLILYIIYFMVIRVEKSLKSAMIRVCSPFWWGNHKCNTSGRRKYSRIIAAAHSSGDTILEKSFNLARMRMNATKANIIADEYAELFADQCAPETSKDDDSKVTANESFDIISYKFIDESVLNIASMVNMNREQDYSQVVLLGDGTCTRFCRLPWPAGTVIYLVAPAEVHERAEAILKDKDAVAPRGCLLRRVSWNLGSCDRNLSEALKDKGFRGDRVSVWGLNGIRALGVSSGIMEHIFSEIANAAAFESIILGEFPEISVLNLENFLAKYGLGGKHIPLQTVCDQCIPGYEGHPDWMQALESFESRGECPRLFRATQRRVSLDEMDMYNSHVAMAEEVDEDFFGNFS
jgi:O-methyltransferase involved in polyketide biosynthesis